MNSPDSRSSASRPHNLGLERFRLTVRSHLRKFPALEVVLRKAWRKGRHYWLRVKWKSAAIVNRVNGHGLEGINTDKLCWVQPDRIEFSSLKEFNLRDQGRVVGGDWDRLEKRFDELDIYLAIKQVLQEGMRWEDTVFYRRIMERINKGEIPYRCRDQNDLNQKCRGIEKLYREISESGYKTQEELARSQGGSSVNNVNDEILINIGRHGDLLFSNSAHRLAIAKLLKLEKVPVKIAVRHPGWAKFINELNMYARDSGGKTYQPILHPDLGDIPAFHGCEDRFEIIRKVITPARGKLLDIGANFGYFSRRFEDLGFDSYAVEVGTKEKYFLPKIRRAQNAKFHIVGESILESNIVLDESFTVVLALNIFHHFLKTEDLFREFVILLKNLKTRELYFEPHHTDEYQMRGAYRNFSPDEFVQFLTENLSLKNSTLIGHASDGRPLYKLY